MAGWDVTVLSAALSLVAGIVWALVRLALDGSRSTIRRMSRQTGETAGTEARLEPAALAGND